MRFLSIFFTLFLLASPLWAAENLAVPAKLSKTEMADVARMETYLNNMKSMEAGFLQVSDNGEMRHGRLAMKRPNRMRVTYDLPSKDFIVADGSFLNMWDDELGSQTSLPIDGSITSFILRDPIKLSGDVTITHFVRFPAKVEISLVSTQDPGDGELTLVFEDKPLQLRQWRVVDPQGRMTGVSLESPREGVSFPPGTFTFVSPKFGKTEQ